MNERRQWQSFPQFVLPILWPHPDCKGFLVSVMRNKKSGRNGAARVTFSSFFVDSWIDFSRPKILSIFCIYLPNAEHTPYEGLCFIPGPIRTTVLINIAVSHIASPAVESFKVAARIIYNDAMLLLNRHKIGSTQGPFTVWLSNTVKLIKSRWICWTGHVARIETVNVRKKICTAARSSVTSPMPKFEDNNKFKLTSVELWNSGRDRKDRKLENVAQKGASWFALLIKHYCGDQIKKD